MENKHQILLAIRQGHCTAMDIVDYINEGVLELKDIPTLPDQPMLLKNVKATLEQTRQVEEERQAKRNEDNRKESQKQYHLEQLGNYDATALRSLIESNTINYQDIINSGIYDERTLNIMLNPPEDFLDFTTWNLLPDMKGGKTDIYVFGVPGSGKSCMLAGLLTYAHQSGLLRKDTSQIVGYRYMDYLIKKVQDGIVPQRTNESVLNYISTFAKGSQNDDFRPWQIVEMSGELFTATYESGSLTGERSIGARNYLHNDNRKQLMFVIDYDYQVNEGEYNARATQAQQLEMVLNLLYEDGTLEKTDALFLVVTKSDTMPSNAPIEETTTIFLEKYYKNFMSTVRDYSKEIGFRTVRHNFSLGKFSSNTVFDFVPTTSAKVYHDMVSLSFLARKKSVLGKFKDYFK